MNYKVQKRLAGIIGKCSPSKAKLDQDRLEEIKESITKADIRGLIKDGAITIKQKKGVSRVRANKIRIQKKKGRQKGQGTRKGTHNARNPHKRTWINKIRLQRRILRGLREKGDITKRVYGELYMKAKGGFFRNKNHLKLYIEEHNLTIKKQAK